MTNREWLLNKMQNMSDEELVNVYVGSHICGEIKRTDCGTTNCIGCKLEWLKSEHKEKITLSEAERIILKNIDKEYKWIARDVDNRLFIFKEKPKTNGVRWYHEKYKEITFFNHRFLFVKCGDAEPYNIEELLKGE